MKWREMALSFLREAQSDLYDDAHWVFQQITVYLKHTYKISLPDS